MYIYTITNIRNGKTYVGQTAYPHPNSRWGKHKNELNTNKHINKHLQNAWNKDGELSFDFEIIDVANSIDGLNSKENYYIEVLNTTNSDFGYNKNSGGKQRYRITEETRCKLSGTNNHNYGRPFKHTAESKEKIRVGHIGKTHTEETIQKMRTIHLGVKNGRYGKSFSHNDEAKQKISTSITKWWTERKNNSNV